MYASSGRDPRLNLSQYLNQMKHVGLFEHAFDTIAVEIGKGRLIQQFRVHHAARGEMVDDQVEEFELIGSQPAALQEFGEGTLGGLPVEPDESTDEPRQSALGSQRAERSPGWTLRAGSVARAARSAPCMARYGQRRRRRAGRRRSWR